MLKVEAQYCTNSNRYTEVQYFDSSQITIGANVQYGTATDYQGNPYALRMDLYYPNLLVDTAPKRPFILLFHGGGFTSGDKQSGDIRDLCIHLALRGFVCASANYRLGYNFAEYDQYKARYRAIQDGHAAMRYIVNNANTIKIDTAWLFVGGQSAGSLLALGMVYADPSELDSISLLYNATPASIELGNLYTSGNNLTNTYTIKGIFNNWGAVTTTEIDREEMLPTIAFHGGADTVVRIDTDASFTYYQLAGSRAIHQTLTAAGVCSELTVDTLGGHGIFRNASAAFRAQRASCFFKSIFCNNCTSLYTTDSIPSQCSGVLSTTEYLATTPLHIYPNPFNQTFYIDGLQGPVQLTIYNSVGQLLHREENSTGQVEVDLLPGIYAVHLKQTSSNSTHILKLIRN